MPHDAVWTTLQLNRNSVAEEHVDKGNEGLSILITAGKYDGGEFYIGNRLILPSGATGHAVIIDGHKMHSSRPYSGLRYSVVAFKHESINQLTPKDLELLVKN